jgi:hypothetical protein
VYDHGKSPLAQPSFVSASTRPTAFAGVGAGSSYSPVGVSTAHVASTAGVGTSFTYTPKPVSGVSTANTASPRGGGVSSYAAPTASSTAYPTATVSTLFTHGGGALESRLVGACIFSRCTNWLCCASDAALIGYVIIRLTATYFG